jgi:Alginate lyase
MWKLIPAHLEAILVIASVLLIGLAPQQEVRADERFCTDDIKTDLAIVSAFDDGTNDGHVPTNTIDGNLTESSRWSSDGSTNTNTTGSTQIIWDLGSVGTVTDLQVVFFRSDQRYAFFDVDTSVDNSMWNPVLLACQSSLTTPGEYETFDLYQTDARYVRFTGYGNSVNTWNSIIEVNIRGCLNSRIPDDEDDDDDDVDKDSDSLVVDVDWHLDPTLPPSGNFDLQDWALSVPVDDDDDGIADKIYEDELSAEYVHPQWFYTADDDGGMVFKAPSIGPTTERSSYARSELREMLRRGDTSCAVAGICKNNWVFSSYPISDRTAAGGVDGELTATLKVDHVTTTGKPDKVGRVVIGQIHARDCEPVRLTYRLLPGHTKGSIYIAHETAGGSTTTLWYDMIGDRSSSASEPPDGIELGEVFRYTLRVDGDMLTVVVTRGDGRDDVVQTVDMSHSGYHDGVDQFMYFKAGVYNINNSGDDDDYAQATFYELVNTHAGYNF